MESIKIFLQEAQRLLGALSFKPPMIFVLGQTNAGKSTLINSLAGQELTPADAYPNTPGPIYISHGPKFNAVITGIKKTEHISSSVELIKALKKKNQAPPPKKIEINTSSEILSWCTLVDTPGIECIKTNHSGLLGEIKSLADGAIFVFHQRGIDLETYDFLRNLSRMDKMPLGITFMININLGQGDGSSLAFTESRLREIYPGQSRVYGISAIDPGSNDLLAMHIKMRIFSRFKRLYEKELLKRDCRLPRLLKEALSQREEYQFLLKTWPLVEECENLCKSWRIALSLPGMSGRMDDLMEENSSRLLRLHPGSSPGKYPSPAAGKLNLESLLEKISRDNVMAPYLKPGWINDIRQRAAEKKCTVMVAGSFSTGKTTFLNALLGENLLPAGDSATTSCPLMLAWGEKKEALIKNKLQIYFKILEPREKDCLLHREDTRALSLLLEEPSLKTDPPDAEVATGGRYIKVSLEELRQRLAETFASLNCSLSRQQLLPTSLKLPLAARKIPRDKGGLITSVRLTFKNQETILYQLENESSRQQFVQAISHPLSLLVEEVRVNYPAPVLCQANFLDTPGMDSLQPSYRQQAFKEATENYILLHFFNGKHLAADKISEDLNTFGISSPVSSNSIAEKFYIINFADTLTPAEKEKVAWHIRSRAMGTAIGAKPVPYPKVYALSSILALQGRDENFNRLVATLMRTAQNNRRRLQEELLPEIRQQLAGASRRAGANGLDQGRNTLIQQWISRYIKELYPVSTAKINFKT